MVRLTWSRQLPALPAVAGAARSRAGRTLADKAARREGVLVDQIGEWTVVRGDDLPWTDGVVYLGVMPEAPRVLVPVHRRPSVPGEVLAAAIRQRVGIGTVAVLPSDSVNDASGPGVLVLLSS